MTPGPTLRIAIAYVQDGDDAVPVRHELKTKVGTLRPGEVLEVPAEQAQYFIRQGLAHEATEAPPPLVADNPPPKPKRKRGRPPKQNPPVVDSIPDFMK